MRTGLRSLVVTEDIEASDRDKKPLVRGRRPRPPPSKKSTAGMSGRESALRKPEFSISPPGKSPSRQPRVKGIKNSTQ
jgi:hypothetical protein